MPAVKVRATFTLPGVVYQIAENEQDPAIVPAHDDPYIRGAVPGGGLFLYGVLVGNVLAVRPDSEPVYEDSAIVPREWLTHWTEVDLILDLPRLLGQEKGDAP